MRIWFTIMILSILAVGGIAQTRHPVIPGRTLISRLVSDSVFVKRHELTPEGELPAGWPRDSIRYAIENAVGGGVPMPDTVDQGGKYLRYNGTEETPFDWAEAGSVSQEELTDSLDNRAGDYAKLSGGNIFSGAQNATDFRASDSVTANTVSTNVLTAGNVNGYIGMPIGTRFRMANSGTATYGMVSDTASGLFTGANTVLGIWRFPGYGMINALQGFQISVPPSRSTGSMYIHDVAFDGTLSGYGLRTTPHQLFIVSRFGPSSYSGADDIGAIGANYTTNSNLSTQAGDVKAIDARTNIGGAHPLSLYTANGSYTPARAFGGSFELNNYARAEVPIGYGVHARVNNAHSNDSTRYGFAAGFKYSQPFWAYGGYDTLYGLHLDDPKYGDVRAAIGLRDTGLIAWRWDTFLKRTGAGTLRLDTNLTAKNIRSDDTLQASKSVLVGNTTGRVGDTTPSIYLANTSGDANNKGVIQEYLNSLNLISQSNAGAATGTLVSLSTQRAAKGFPSRGALVVDTLQRVIIGQYSTPVSHRADSSLTVHPNQPMANTSANPVSDSLTGGGGHFYGGLQVDKGLNVTGTTATGNLRIENLGDGLLTTESGDVVVSAIVPNILPDTSGNAGKLLQYTGEGFDWVAETPVDSANLEKKSTIRQLFASGLIDSVKTTDTLFLGAIYPAATVDTLRVDALGAVDVTMIVEVVDSLNQSSGQTSVCTTTVTNARKLISSFDEAALLNGKILRVRFTTVGTMPKQIIITVLGHR